MTPENEERLIAIYLALHKALEGEAELVFEHYVMEVGDGILPGSLGKLVEKAFPDDKLREANLR